MATRGKKYKKIIEKKLTSSTSLKNAIEATKKLSYSTFPGTIELHLALILPKDKDPKSIKGSVSLPNMESKVSKIAVAVPAHLEAKAKEAGADIVGLDAVLEVLKTEKIDFDILISVPEVMVQLAAFGKALGPRGLMPNPKNGTVVSGDKIADTIGEFKRGKLVFKADSAGGIHVSVGKVGLETEKIAENVKAVINTVSTIIGKSKEYVIRRAFLAPTMGPATQFEITLLD